MVAKVAKINSVFENISGFAQTELNLLFYLKFKLFFISLLSPSNTLYLVITYCLGPYWLGELNIVITNLPMKL